MDLAARAAVAPVIAVFAALAAIAAPAPGCQTQACVRRVQHKRIMRETRRVTPYRCSFGRSAIPCYVVLCESHGKWSAYNPSGAASLYQLMPVHGRPWPVTTPAHRLAHHRIAARLWAGGRGAHHWVCS